MKVDSNSTNIHRCFFVYKPSQRTKYKLQTGDLQVVTGLLAKNGTFVMEHELIYLYPRFYAESHILVRARTNDNTNQFNRPGLQMM